MSECYLFGRIHSTSIFVHQVLRMCVRNSGHSSFCAMLWSCVTLHTFHGTKAWASILRNAVACNGGQPPSASNFLKRLRVQRDVTSSWRIVSLDFLALGKLRWKYVTVLWNGEVKGTQISACHVPWVTPYGPYSHHVLQTSRFCVLLRFLRSAIQCPPWLWPCTAAALSSTAPVDPKKGNPMPLGRFRSLDKLELKKATNMESIGKCKYVQILMKNMEKSSLSCFENLQFLQRKICTCHGYHGFLSTSPQRPICGLALPDLLQRLRHRTSL